MIIRWRWVTAELRLPSLAPRFCIMIDTWRLALSWRNKVFVKTTPFLINSCLTRSNCWQNRLLLIVSSLSSTSWCTIPCLFHQTHSITFLTNLSGFGSLVVCLTTVTLDGYYRTRFTFHVVNNQRMLYINYFLLTASKLDCLFPACQPKISIYSCMPIGNTIGEWDGAELILVVFNRLMQVNKNFSRLEIGT